MSGLRRSAPWALVLAGALAAGAWASTAEPDPDFLRLHAAGALVAEGKATALYDRAPPAAGPAGKAAGPRPFRMPPAAGVACAPLGVLPEGTAWVLWAAACGAMAAGGIALAAAAAAREGSCGATVLLATAIPLAPLLVGAAVRGGPALSLFALGCGAVFAFRRGADRIAGLCAGAAAALHLAPVLLPFWFLWKRRWRAAAWGFGVAVALAVALPCIAAGPSGGTTLLRQWGSMSGLLVTELDERPGTMAGPAAARIEGQSPEAALSRVLSGWKWYRLREMPLSPDEEAVASMVSVGPSTRVSQGTVGVLAFVLSFLLLATVIFATGPRAGTGDGDPALEGGLILCAVPLVWIGAREHHFLLCAPALAALAALPRPRPRVATALGAAGALLLFLSSDLVAGRACAAALLARGSAGWGGLLLFAAVALTLFARRGTGGGAAADRPDRAP